MHRTMKAAVVRAFGKPLAIEEIPVPAPGPGEVLVRGSRLRRLPHRSARDGRRLAGEAERPLCAGT